MNSPIDRLNDALSGRYRIERELGEGGMATVYLARDERHDRQVAIKVLRRELAAVLGAERFLAEIRTTANLQHPHILPLFDSGEADGFLYYVMPYVEGETLRARLDREQQLPVDEAVGIARDVADALDYAHRQGVIHRDIKPANILLHEGRPLVADFGIALAVSAAGAGRLTETGLSLGTPYYMSPEQASAERDLTARSDVYSLGCVLYEMLAGQPPHTGPTTQSVLMRILTEDPRPLLELRRAVPAHVAATVMKAIEKLPADRFATAEDLEKALDDRSFTWTAPHGAETGGAAEPSHDARPEPAVLRWLPWGLAAVLGALAVWLAFDSPPVSYPPSIAFDVVDGIDGSRPAEAPRVASNGAIAWREDSRIAVRPPEGGDARIAIDLGDLRWQDHDLSPEGDALVVSWQELGGASGLTKVSIDGSQREIIWSAPSGRTEQLFWGEDGWIYFTWGRALARVPDIGGDSEELRVFDNRHEPLDLLPGGDGLLYKAISGGEVRGFTHWIGVLDLETGDTTVVLPDARGARWSPTGHVVFEHVSGALWAVPFDPRSFRTTGPANLVQPDVAVRSFADQGFDLSRSGTLVFEGGPSPESEEGRRRFLFALMDPSGMTDTLPVDPAERVWASLSPDGSRLAYTRDGEMWTYDLDLGNSTRISRDEVRARFPTWSPGGDRVAFSATDTTDTTGERIVLRNADGSGERTEVVSLFSIKPDQWLEDGTLLFSAGGSNSDIMSIPADGSGAAASVLVAEWHEREGRVSPDGRWMAYVSERSGSARVYVRSWPELADEVLVSEERPNLEFPRAASLIWAPDSRVLYYQQVDPEQDGVTIVAASLDPGGRLAVADRDVVLALAEGTLLDLAPDGRFLVAVPFRDGGAGTERRLVAVTNWFTRLRERMAP